jgi:peroxiredoxin
VHEGGYAEINSDELKEERPLQLQAWGELKGVMMIGREPGAGKSIQLMRQTMHGPGSLNFGSHFRVDTDEQGRFSFSHVPPGPIQLARLIPMGPRSWTFSHVQSVLIPPGETIEVVYGGTGRPVTGRLALSDPGREVDWRHGHNSLSTKMPQPPQGSSREEIMAWQQSEEFRDAIANRRSYGIVIDEEGSFRVDDVPAGEYRLSFNLTEPADDRPGMGTPIGSLSREVTVPGMAEARSDEPLDLGELIIQVRNTLRIGDTAPDFEVETLSGERIKLSDFRGKVVLLDFWATWCGPCIAELPHLKAVYEEFGQDERFAMIALSLDAEKKEPQEFVKKNELKWIQGFLGEWPKTNVPAQYGVQGIPATFVIGPDGTIQAMNLRGTAIRAGVERVLRSRETVAAP